jgi:hypothetical protein
MVTVIRVQRPFPLLLAPMMDFPVWHDGLVTSWYYPGSDGQPSIGNLGVYGHPGYGR